MKRDTEKEFTGYVVREDYDLNGLRDYGFTKTTPVDTNPWWQRPFNMTLNVFIEWDCELQLRRDDRRLLKKVDPGANTDRLQATLEKMIRDGVLVKV